MKKWLLALLVGFLWCGLSIAAVNINTATKEELMSLKGIGEKGAQDIIDYRSQNGPFKTIDDLEKVPGIGPGTMKQLRGQITTTGSTVINKSAGVTKTRVSRSKPAKKIEAKKSEVSTGEALNNKNGYWTVTNDRSKSDPKAKPAKKSEAKKSKDDKKWK
jgi:competence protein ComEA